MSIPITKDSTRLVKFPTKTGMEKTLKKGGMPPRTREKLRKGLSIPNRNAIPPHVTALKDQIVENLRNNGS